MHMCMCMCMCMSRWVRGQGTSSGQHSQGVRKGDGDAGAERGPKLHSEEGISCLLAPSNVASRQRRLFGNAPQVCTLCGRHHAGPPHAGRTSKFDAAFFFVARPLAHRPKTSSRIR